MSATSGHEGYEAESTLHQYLLFHYGTREEITPWTFAPVAGWTYPVDCAELLSRHVENLDRALDLGCAVGRSSFELARRARHVLGIDFSHAFINAASTMAEVGRVACHRSDTVGSSSGSADQSSWLELGLDPGIDRTRVHFRQGDACELPGDLGTFDAVLLANLIDRLPDPLACLERLPGLVRPGGAVLITSPYTWLESYTPRDKWLGDPGNDSTLDALQGHLQASFSLVHREDMPFLIREHRRKYQWSVAEATVWIRRES